MYGEQRVRVTAWWPLSWGPKLLATELQWMCRVETAGWRVVERAGVQVLTVASRFGLPYRM